MQKSWCVDEDFGSFVLICIEGYGYDIKFDAMVSCLLFSEGQGKLECGGGGIVE